MLLEREHRLLRIPYDDNWWEAFNSRSTSPGQTLWLQRGLLENQNDVPSAHEGNFPMLEGLTSPWTTCICSSNTYEGTPCARRRNTKAENKEQVLTSSNSQTSEENRFKKKKKIKNCTKMQNIIGALRRKTWPSLEYMCVFQGQHSRTLNALKTKAAYLRGKADSGAGWTWVQTPALTSLCLVTLAGYLTSPHLLPYL